MVKRRAAKRTQAVISTSAESVDPPSLAIYVSSHCPTCAYAYEVAEEMQRDFPKLVVRLVNIDSIEEIIPEAVFATPTYLLNGRVWSLGNPSPEKIQETFRNFPPNTTW